MTPRYRPAIVPDPPANFVVCLQCTVSVDDNDEARDQHDLYHTYYLDPEELVRQNKCNNETSTPAQPA